MDETIGSRDEGTTGTVDDGTTGAVDKETIRALDNGTTRAVDGELIDELAALTAAYRDLIAIVTDLDEPASWRPTGCTGFAVRDLVFHLLGDAQRALVALAGASDGSQDTPEFGPPDRDAVTYWSDFPAGAPDPQSRQIRAIRTIAATWRFDNLVESYAETARAVLALAARTPSHQLITTQGHVLRVADLLATLAFEAAVHHMDLVLDLDRPGPGAVPLALVRRTLDGLLGSPAPTGWDDVAWARIGTGRQVPTLAERAELSALGADPDRLPLLG
jgi:hypothetical protein